MKCFAKRDGYKIEDRLTDKCLVYNYNMQLYEFCFLVDGDVINAEGQRHPEETNVDERGFLSRDQLDDLRKDAQDYVRETARFLVQRSLQELKKHMMRSTNAIRKLCYTANEKATSEDVNRSPTQGTAKISKKILLTRWSSITVTLNGFIGTIC